MTTADASTTDHGEQKSLGFEEVDPEMKVVPLSDIRPNLSDGDTAIQSSVDTLGLVSTPVLQPSPADPDYGFRIVDGRRRIDAARDGGREEIHAYVIPADVGAEADALTFLLNLARSPSPLREAEALSDLVDSGYTVEALARLGPPKSTIEKRLRLAAAPGEIKDGVRADEIATGVAEKVANLSPTLQDRCVEYYLEEGQLRHKDVKSLRTAKRNEEASALPDTLFDTPDVTEPGSSPPESSDPEEETNTHTGTEQVEEALRETDSAPSLGGDGDPSTNHANGGDEDTPPEKKVRHAAREAVRSGMSPNEVLRETEKALEAAIAVDI